MRKAILMGLVLTGLAVLAGCIDSTTTVTVKTDGSGTIERSLVVSKQLVELMVGMGMGADEAAVQSEMLDLEDMQKDAQTMGTGVTFVSAEPITTSKGNGFRATYRFTDITKVKIDQSPSGSVDLPESPNPENAPAGPELVTFEFAKGTPATLTIRTPKPKPESTTSAAPAPTPAEGGEEAAAMMEMFRGLYADMRVVMNVVVQGTITRTNAAHVSGATVTLMELDFGSLMTDDALFKKLVEGNTQSLAEAQTMLKGVPGFKMETQESVTITFR